ncbi:hypothetical protein ABMA27_006151 [Loxostege sticticalis]|uniref:Chemosensory protein n=1 Tax=Loxostege sticticalis TaxID=481309 RepID=A0ABR3HHR3_LOXSC
MKFIVVLAVIVGLAMADEKYTSENDNFDVDALVANIDELKKFSGCFLDINDCDAVAADFKKDIPEAFQQACAKCTDAQKHIFKKFIAGLKEKLPHDYEAFMKKYDPESKFYPALEKVINV